MTESWTTQQLNHPDSGCPGDVLSGLPLTNGLPDLRDLAVRLAARCLQTTPAAGVAAYFPVPGAGLLEPGWDRASRNCVYMTVGSEGPVWTAKPGDWNPSPEPSGISGGHGTGPWPEQWPLPRGQNDWSWQEQVFRLAEQPVLVVLAVHPAGTRAAESVRAHLLHEMDSLSPLFQVWMTARRLDSDLRRVHTENQALIRLSTMQQNIVAMASHEFKTPLTSITAYTDALKPQISDAEFPHAAEFLEVIRTEAARLLRMVNRILDFSRVGAGLEMLGVKPEEIGPLVKETILTMRPALAAKGLEMETEVAAELPRAEIDADLIRQVLVNLMSNAVKYTPSGGRITLAVAETEASVRISVADTGLGIPNEDLQRIFREFYRTPGKSRREEGTGLGLTIVRNIVNLHGGYIEANHRPGGGTVFVCDLPKETEAPAPLPLEFTKRVNRTKAWRLISLLSAVVAELTASRAVAWQLRNGHGGLATVAVMGAAEKDFGTGPVQEVDLVHAGKQLGTLRIGRPMPGRDYGPATSAQLQVLARMAALALGYLTAEHPADDDSSGNTQLTKVIDAVRAVLQIKRSGVPTSTAEALGLVAKLGRRLGVESEDIDRLQYAALLHDAGMARVEVEIVRGESELSWDQRDEVERHVEQGLDLMAPLLLDPETATIIRHHHERIDGTGYPDGLTGGKIPVGARLLAVIDAWFALTRDRSFRPGLQPVVALEEVKSHAGNQFDAEVVAAFEDVLKNEGIIPDIPAENTN